MSSKQVLVVEDDDALARLLQDNLARNGFTVERVATARDGCRKLEHASPTFVLLDLTLPDGNGFQICQMLNKRVERPLVIILSARDTQADKIRGLDFGADDYMTKPFSFEELLARMRALTRRRRTPLDVLHLGKVTVDFRTRSATQAGRDLGLSYRETEVLRYLAERPCIPVSRDELLQAVWGYGDMPVTRSVDICIARLRRKIEPDPHHPQYIRTAHGDGYMLSLVADTQ